jgi:hypothetical protein
VVTAEAFPESPTVPFFFIGFSETEDSTAAFLIQRLNSRDDPPSFPQVRASGLLHTDLAGEIPLGVIVVESPTLLVQFRWDDYSAITLDPSAASCAWGVNEKVNASFTWSSRFFSGCLQ